MSRESDILDEIERRQSELKNMTAIESRLLDKVVDLDDQITEIEKRFDALEKLVREKVLTVVSPDIDSKLIAVYDLLKHLAYFESAISIEKNKIIKNKPEPAKSGFLSKVGLT